MVIYLAEDYKVYNAQDAQGTRTPVETAYFDGKCKAYLEGYRFLPEGAQWEEKDGNRVQGPAVFPWKAYDILEAAQGAYEEALAQIQPQIDDIFVAMVEG